MIKNYYRILGVSRNADDKRIRQAWRKGAKALHPDTATPGVNSREFIDMLEAYETLRDPVKRQVYDRSLHWEEKRKKTAYHGQSPPYGPMEPEFPTAWSGNREMFLEIILSTREAATGGVYTVSVPVLEPCPSCWKRYLIHPECNKCKGRGRVISSRSIRLDLPARVKNGMRFRFGLEDAGLRGAVLNVDIRVESSPVM